ncbi:MAG: RNA polymerase sigma factor [Flavobacteriales bacterium]
MTMEVNPNLSEKARRDYELVQRALENDQMAYAEIMDRYRDSIFHLINKMVFSSDDADDLTIETFTKAFQRLNQYSPAYAFSTWLFKIASNHTIDFIRKKRLNALSLDQGFANADGDVMEFHVRDEGLDPMETLQKKERVGLMRDVVSQMKPRYRRLVELRYFEEMSYEEISAELDLPLGTVKAQLFRARDILSALITPAKETL